MSSGAFAGRLRRAPLIWPCTSRADLSFSGGRYCWAPGTSRSMMLSSPSGLGPEWVESLSVM